jgi:hypothetical protein
LLVSYVSAGTSVSQQLLGTYLKRKETVSYVRAADAVLLLLLLLLLLSLLLSILHSNEFGYWTGIYKVL